MKSFQELRIIFLGTPDFAVASLKALLEAGATIIAVITAPDKPAGRGMHLHESAVKQFAIANNLYLLQPEKLKAPDFISELHRLNADLQIVVAFRMMPEIVWNMPPMGTINVHASLLPMYRGAAPINWAIINGEKQTGVTTFRLKHEIDTGDILLQETIDIVPEDTAGTLHDKLMNAGAKLLVTTVKACATDSLKEIPQKDIPVVDLRIAPKIFKTHCEINWHKTCTEINNQIRGLSPYPTAFTLLAGKQIKVFKSHFVLENHKKEIGLFETDHQHYLRFATNDGWLYIDELQQEGKKKLDIVTFLRGFRAS